MAEDPDEVSWGPVLRLGLLGYPKAPNPLGKSYALTVRVVYIEHTPKWAQGKVLHEV